MPAPKKQHISAPAPDATPGVMQGALTGALPEAIPGAGPDCAAPPATGAPADAVQISRAQVMAVRSARRYLKRGDGTLARILNAYKEAQARGSVRGYLAEN